MVWASWDPVESTLAIPKSPSLSTPPAERVTAFVPERHTLQGCLHKQHKKAANDLSVVNFSLPYLET